MIMSILTITLMILACLWATSFNAHYCFRFLAYKFYTIGELSDEFRTQFSSQLTQCSLPCKRLISSHLGAIVGTISESEGHDNRPIIYAAGEIYINEDICQHFSPEIFAAGLAYEEAHYYSGYYMYSILMTFIIFAGCMPLIAKLNNITQPLLHSKKLLSVFAHIINLLYIWPLLQFIVITGGMIVVEYTMGKSVVNFYAKNNYDLENLLQYLKYVESHATVGLNRLFNITSNRKYCEKFLTSKTLA